jgi:hypothetical protein
MVTHSTGYQRPHPRIRARSCPFLLLMAITCPSGHCTLLHPRKACSHRAALISWRFDDGIGPSSWAGNGLGGREHKQLLGRGRRAKEGVQVDENLHRQLVNWTTHHALLARTRPHTRGRGLARIASWDSHFRPKSLFSLQNLSEGIMHQQGLWQRSWCT